MVLIRKYGNRRLYDTRASRYVNLEDVATIIRGGEEVKVVDVKTEEDLTREVLLQVILEAQGGVEFLPTPLLRRIIRATGDDPAQRLLRQQLATAFELLQGQLERVEGQWMGMFPGFFRAPPKPGGDEPRGAATPPPEPSEPASEPGAAPAARPSDAPPGDDLAALRARLDQLERRLKRG